MEFRAQARYMRVTPQKARLVLNLIKGRRVEDALNTLVFTKKRVAATVEKLLRSALENANYLSAEKGIDVDVDMLYVKKCNRQRWSAHEANPACSHGPCLPLRAPNLAHRARPRRAWAQRWRELATVVGCRRLHRICSARLRPAQGRSSRRRLRADQLLCRP